MRPILFLSFALLLACQGSKKLHLPDDSQHRVSVLDFQQSLNEGYASPQSPLREEDKAEFKGLDFFPINPEYQVLADFRRTPEERPFPMPTSTDRTPIYIKYAEATFPLRGDTITLNLYRSPKIARMEGMKYHLFLPFTDLTSGNTTYGGGRYLDLTIPKGDKIIIDFNKAYHPYCLYNDTYSCPIPPSENFIDQEIRAGVRL